MDRATARRVLGVDAGADRRAVEAAFRARVRTAHPDTGGDADGFDRLVRARAALLGPAPASGPPLVVVPDPSPSEQVRAALRALRRRGEVRPRRVV